MTMTNELELEGVAVELDRGIAFLVDVRQNALRRLHAVAVLRESLAPTATRTDDALAAMQRSLCLVLELADELLDERAWEPTQAAAGGAL